MVSKKAHAAAVKVFYETVIEPIRVAARTKGYAIAVHGSLARDIDLVAIPWTLEACPLHELVETVQGAPHHALTGEKKPHGRRAWSIYLTDKVYIDLSVMPRLA